MCAQRGLLIFGAGCLLLFWVVFMPSIVLAGIDVEMRLNDTGYISFDHFKAELVIDTDDVAIENVKIFGVLEIQGEYFYWPSFRNDVNFETRDSIEGLNIFTLLEFDLPDIDQFTPFGPIHFWGGWYENAGNNGFDVQEFWLGFGHRMTRWVYIAPGSFIMGSPETEPCRFSDETQHQVTLTRGFYMMQTEVTRQMWADLKAVQPTLPNDPSYTSYSPTMDHPVQSNTWYESVLFANLLSVQYGFVPCYYKDAGFTTPVDATNFETGSFYCNFNASGYRLPTESEWEYACRGGTTTAFSCSETNYTSGNCWFCIPGIHSILEQYCDYCANAPGFSSEVGSKLPNPAGLYDIHGNVWEWCWDWYGAYPPETVSDYAGAESGWNRVNRGGSWLSFARYCRSAFRDGYAPYFRSNVLGFRLARASGQ